MKKYILTMSSDQGNFKMIVTAPSMVDAIHYIMDAEKCPESAILNIKTA